jgi:hypothetical protein
MRCTTTSSRGCVDTEKNGCVTINPKDRAVSTGLFLPLYSIEFDSSINPPFRENVKWLEVFVEDIPKEAISIDCIARYTYRPCGLDVCNSDHCPYIDELHTDPYQCVPAGMKFVEPRANLLIGSTCYDEHRYYVSGRFLGFPFVYRSHYFMSRPIFTDENGDTACVCQPDPFSTFEFDIGADLGYSEEWTARYVNGKNIGKDIPEYLKPHLENGFSHFGYYCAYWSKYNTPPDQEDGSISCSGLCGGAKEFFRGAIPDISGKTQIVLSPLWGLRLR